MSFHGECENMILAERPNRVADSSGSPNDDKQFPHRGDVVHSRPRASSDFLPSSLRPSPGNED